MTEDQTRDYIVREDDVIIEDVIISTSVGGETSIFQSMISLGFYEDIFGGFMTGQLLMVDGNNLIRKLPIMGREFVKVIFRTPLAREKKTLIMRVCGQLSRSMNDKKRQNVLELRLISPTGYKNMITKFSKSYRGTYSKIVRNICSDAFQSPVFVDETFGDNVVCFPYSSAMQMISQIRPDSVPERADNKIESSGFVFYETSSGLNFRCLNLLFTQIPREDLFFVKSFSTRNSESVDDLTFKTHVPKVLTMNRSFDRMTQHIGGAFSNTQYSYDITNKSWGINTFNYTRDSDIVKKESEIFNPVITQREVDNQSPSTFSFVERSTQRHDGVGESDTRSQTQRYAMSNYALCNDTEVEIEVPGNSDLEAGKTVILTITKNDTDAAMKEGDNDSEKSGVYLIKNLQHRFFFSSDETQTMKTKLCLVRNFRGEPASTSLEINDGS
jgi:hypothetical protein